MGEIADMMLDGTLCSQCGTFISMEPSGIPTLCPDCERETKEEAKKKQATALARRNFYKGSKMRKAMGRSY